VLGDAQGQTTMASPPTVTSEPVTVPLPIELLRELDEEAARQGRTRHELLESAANFYLRTLRWREIQAVVAPAFAAAGMRTDDDVEPLIDSLPDPD
jgi:metal-responsive CopG/Arc/MetJ family transcriptional regulator